MHTSGASAARIPQLDRLNATPGTRVVFYDPTASQYGLPTYPWKWAPKHLKTRRQLAALGLRPGGQHPVAQILWRKGGRVAYLYDIDRALPKRKPTSKQLDALGKALRARRTKRSNIMSRSIENPDYAAFLKRIVRAYTKRIAAGDIEALADLSGVAAELDHAIAQAVTELRAQHGYSWADIARPLGITRQAAQQRWGGESA